MFQRQHRVAQGDGCYGGETVALALIGAAAAPLAAQHSFPCCRQKDCAATKLLLPPGRRRCWHDLPYIDKNPDEVGLACSDTLALLTSNAAACRGLCPWCRATAKPILRSALL